MTVQQLRDTLRKTPFQPFTIRMADRRLFRIPHPDFLSMSPSGRTVIVYEADDEMHILDLLLITEIEATQLPLAQS